MAHPGGRPLKFKTPEELLEKGIAYFKDMQEQKRPITITGLCIALGTFRDVLMDYQDERGEEFSNAVKTLKIFCENYAEEQLFIGKNAAGAIFALKNYKWTDKSEHEMYGKDGDPLFKQYNAPSNPTMNGTVVPTQETGTSSPGNS
jgi:hypothetical protein